MGQPLEQQLNVLRLQYAKDLAQKIPELEGLWMQMADRGPTAVSLRECQFIAHSLAGSSGTFGFPEISEIAQALEAELERITPETSARACEARKDIQNLIGRLMIAIDGPSTPGTGEKAVCVICEDESLRLSLSADLNLPGLKFCSSSSLTEGALAGVIVDLDEIELTEARENLQKLGRRRYQTPIVFTSQKTDFNARLSVIRAGGDILISKPILADELIQALQEIGSTKKTNSFRVLIFENHPASSSPSLFDWDQTVFSMSYIHDPERILAKLDTFRPELLLVDFESPKYDGLEIARMVWQLEDFQNMPVLFKCSDYEACRRAFKAGLCHEDLLAEPLTQDKISSAIARSVRQARAGIANDQRFLPFLHCEAGLAEPEKHDHEQQAQDLSARLAEHPVALVVDDDEPIRKALKVVLENSGFEVLVADNGDSGFYLALRERPDVVITDYNMPGGSGHYMLTRLNASQETRKIPVIVLTGQKIDGKKDLALEREMMGRQGAKAYLTKPLDLDTLVAEVKRVLEEC